jgi:hypothetical protein
MMTEALQYACAYGNVDAVESFLQTRKTTELLASNSHRAFRWAVVNGHVDIARRIAQTCQTTATMDYSCIEYAVKWSCANGHVHSLEYLTTEHRLDAALVRDIVTKNRALFWAAVNNNVNTIEWLFLNGYVRAEDIINRSSDDDKQQFDVFKRLCFNGNVGAIQGFFGKYGDLAVTEEAVLSEGGYVVRWAARNGHLQLFKLLLAHVQQHIEHLTDVVSCSYMWACQNGHLDVVQYIVERFPRDALCTERDDCYAFRWLCRLGHTDVLRYLHECGLVKAGGADAFARDAYGFRWAAYKGHIMILRFLLEELCLDKATFIRDSTIKRAHENGHVAVVVYLSGSRSLTLGQLRSICGISSTDDASSLLVYERPRYMSRAATSSSSRFTTVAVNCVV